MNIKSVPREGYEHYFVSDTGQVYSQYHEGHLRLLKPKIDKCRGGYHIYDLRHIVHGRKKRLFVRVHQLVAWTFIGPQAKGLHVRHLDDDPTNNNLSNLAYGTPKENERDKVINRYRKLMESENA